MLFSLEYISLAPFPGRPAAGTGVPALGTITRLGVVDSFSKDRLWEQSCCPCSFVAGSKSADGFAIGGANGRDRREPFEVDGVSRFVPAKDSIVSIQARGTIPTYLPRYLPYLPYLKKAKQSICG